MSSEILDNLTEPQLAAVTHKDGPMLVIAGAGSGKTRVVTRRIAWLISQGVWPSQILAMTFTNKAAREMRERVAALVGQAPQNIGTFHGCCARFLRRDIDKLDCGRTRDFTIYDDGDQKSIIKAIITEKRDLPKGVTPSFVAQFISNVKNGDAPYETVAVEMECPCSVKDIIELAQDYEKRLIACNAVDFDDLLRLTVDLLRKVPGMRDIYHNRFRYLLIDEYQDTNHLQYELMKLLVNEQQNVHVTGDPDQSIYSWRGADYHNIMSFGSDFPQAKIIKLEQNYRSTPSILNAANELIKNNSHRFDKNLFTENPDGVQVADLLTENDRSEAEWIRRKIAGAHAHGHPWRNFAIFYRTNAQSRTFEEEFIHYGIPYQLMGGVRFYDRKEIRDFLALLRLKVNPCDQQAFLRVVENFPQCNGIGHVTMNSIIRQAEESGRPLLEFLSSQQFRDSQKGNSTKAHRLRILSNWLDLIVKQPVTPVLDAVAGIEKASDFIENLQKQYGTENLSARKENMESFISRAADFTKNYPEASLADYLEDVALVADVDAHDPEADSVVLMTLHSSKGLEFPCVFIAGCEDGLLPHSLSCDRPSEEDIEEERRLFYVGITRAKRAAYLTHVKIRFRRGMLTAADPSPFLGEIPEGLRKRIEYKDGIERIRTRDYYDTPYIPPPKKNHGLRWSY
ncbi:MAG: UvrD-helicase domain-containing protein [Lentisphaeria bacterium]|nr:UvrD-helicase domain-containing protein [Lentisphaeria bacterium]